MGKKMVEVSHQVEFDGDIMITDPVYVCSDWMRGVPGGIVRDTIYGDWGCTAYDMTGNRRRTPHGDEPKLGNFCADSGMVCVCPLETAEACGGEGCPAFSGGNARDACGMHYAICDATRGGCGASSGWGETLDEVADKWNARAVTPAAARESGHVYD